MFNLRLETKNLQPEQVKIYRHDDGLVEVFIPTGHWTRESLTYAVAYAMADHVKAEVRTRLERDGLLDKE